MKRNVSVLALLLVVLGLRHAQLYYSATEVLHLEPLADALAALQAGDWWSTGQELGTSRVLFGGPLYALLSAPSLLLSRNPVLGLQLNYLLLEALGLAVWVLWPCGGTVRREVRWLGAALLVLLPEAKLELCENATLMAYLLPPVLITTLGGLRSGAWRAMLLPGVVLGLAVQVHALAAALAPALVLAVVWERRLVWRRLALLGLGLAVALAPLVPGAMGGPGAGADGGLWQWLGANVSWPRVALGLLHLVKDPLVLLGLGLMLIGWRRGARPSAAQVLAAAWVFCGVLAASLAYSSEARAGAAGFDPFMPRFALINPGRALLAGLGALWLLDLLDRRITRRWGRRLLPGAVLGLGLLVAAGVLAVAVSRGKGRLDQEYRLVSGDACMCDLLNSHYLARMRKRSFDELGPGPASAAASPAAAHGRLGRELAMARIWSGQRQDSTGALAAVPLALGLNQAKLPRARVQGRVLLVPGSAALDPAALSRGKLVLPQGAAPGAQLLVMLETQGHQPEFRLSLSSAGSALPLQSSCQCRKSIAFTGGWYLYRLPDQPVNLSRIKLEVGGVRKGEHRAWGMVLPRR